MIQTENDHVEQQSGKLFLLSILPGVTKEYPEIN